MITHIVKSLVLSLVLMVVCGLGYNLVVTGIAQAIASEKANGSLVYDGQGHVIGSELIGQKFEDPKFFQSRISSIEYNGAGSGTPNYAPSNQDMIKRTTESIENWRKENPNIPVAQLPIDLITNSGSGLDPHISPEAALAQVPRIHQLTGLDRVKLEALIQENAEGRELGLFGEPRVNVLKLNIALNGLLK